MKGIIVDTSVWIDFFNGVTSGQVERLVYYIENNYPVYLCPLILMEILQGFKDDTDYLSVKKILLEYPMLQEDQISVAIGAADLYRKLRKKGITIRKSNDCIIAYLAMRFKLPVLHTDRDFSIISKYTKMKVVEIK